MTLDQGMFIGFRFWLEWAELYFFRADGNCECPVCGKPYWKHPFTPHRSWNDDPYLHLLCTGAVVKL